MGSLVIKADDPPTSGRTGLYITVFRLPVYIPPSRRAATRSATRGPDRATSHKTETDGRAQRRPRPAATDKVPRARLSRDCPPHDGNRNASKAPPDCAR